MRHQFRVTKYNPEWRGLDGAFQRDQWTSFSDVGKIFDGQVLEKTEYLRVEATYAASVEAFMLESGIKSMALLALEKRPGIKIPAFVAKGSSLNVSECKKFSQLALRERVWGKLGIPGVAYVHFGYDYYMYIGTPRACPKAVLASETAGLFVEPFRSPYLRARPNFAFNSRPEA